MKKENYKSMVIGAVLPLILTLLGQLFYFNFFGDNGKMEIISSIMSDNSHQTIITTKNMNDSEYLENIEISINGDININSVKLNGKEIKIDKTISFGKIRPKSVSTIIIDSKQKLNEEDFNIIKNGSKISIENFNNVKNFKIIFIYIIIAYFVINLIMSLYLDHKLKKRLEEINIINESIKKECEKNEEELKKINRNLSVNKIAHIKEMNDLEKENNFYQTLLNKKIDNKLTKDEIENIIMKELKTFNKKKFKHLNYEDVYGIVSGIVDLNTENSNINGQ